MSEQQEQCPRCQAVNAYSLAACMTCGARLPWADAVDAMRREVAERTAQEQAQKLALAQEEAKAAKAQAKLQAKTVSSSQSSASSGPRIVFWVLVCLVLGTLAWIMKSAQQQDRRDYEEYRRLEQQQEGGSSSTSNQSLSLSAFNQLTTGMSPDTVTSILGPPSSTSTFEMSGVTTLGYNWSSGSAMVSAAFQNGGLVTKSQSGLQ